MNREEKRKRKEQPPRLPWRSRALNAGINFLPNFIASHVPKVCHVIGNTDRAGFSVDNLLRQATKVTGGLSDLAPQFNGFESSFRTYLHDVNEQIHDLTPVGKLNVWNNLERLLAARLLVIDALKGPHADEIKNERIVKPIIIIGLPRTGSTLLQTLLSLDDEHRRPLRLYEAMNPALPASEMERRILARHRSHNQDSEVAPMGCCSVLAARHEEPGASECPPDPRLAEAARLHHLASLFSPKSLQAIHPLRVTGPEECTFLFVPAMYRSYLSVMLQAPSWTNWLCEQRATRPEEIKQAYQFHQLCLKIIQWQARFLPEHTNEAEAEGAKNNETTMKTHMKHSANIMHPDRRSPEPNTRNDDDPRLEHPHEDDTASMTIDHASSMSTSASRRNSVSTSSSRGVPSCGAADAHAERLHSPAAPASRGWVLKSPFHLGGLDALLATYPDACLVWTHRDVRQVVPSWCNLSLYTRICSYVPGAKAIDPHLLGKEWLEGLAWAANMGIRLRNEFEQQVAGRPHSAVNAQAAHVSAPVDPRPAASPASDDSKQNPAAEEQSVSSSRPELVPPAAFLPVSFHPTPLAQKNPANPFFNVSYGALVADPVAVIESLYGYFDLPFSERFRTRLEEYAQQENRKKAAKKENGSANSTKRQKNDRAPPYSLEQFGLTEEAVSRAFQQYEERFQRELAAPQR